MTTTVPNGFIRDNSGALVLASNADVVSKLLTGYTSGVDTVAATDSIVQDIGKLNSNIKSKPCKVAVFYHCGCKDINPVLTGNFSSIEEARKKIIRDSLVSVDKQQFNQYKQNVIDLELKLSRLFREGQKLQPTNEVDQSYWIAKRQIRASFSMQVKDTSNTNNSPILMAFPSKRHLFNLKQRYPRFHRLKLSNRIENDEVWKRHFKQYYENNMEVYYANINAIKCFHQLSEFIDFCHQPTVWLLPIFSDTDITKLVSTIKLDR